MTLEINESWIKERIKLEHDNLDDVKSLSLPGTYHEKISSLGYSLLSFSRIQHLDLSKNNISSLKGLEHLSLLENLNVYYNKIDNLKEIFRLRINQNLREIDLRLNPVTGNEPDYRLFIAHMLPLLRRLDDRPVRDSERKAAILHFNSTQSPEREMFDSEIATKQKQPRVEHVKNFTRKPSVVTDDEVTNDVIDYITKSKQPSTKSTMGAQLHTREDLVKIVRKEENKNKNSKPERDYDLNNDENLNFFDESEAYSKFKSVANFTPHPGSDLPPPTVNQISAVSQTSSVSQMTSSIDMSPASEKDFKTLPEGKKLNFGESTTSQEVSRRKNIVQIRFIEALLDTVDRYWNGSRSLHYHQKFQSLIQEPLNNYEQDLVQARQVQIKVLHDKVAKQEREIINLQQKVKQGPVENKQNEQNEDKVEQLSKELDSAKHRLQLTLSDNKILRTKIENLQEQSHNKKENREEEERLRRRLEKSEEMNKLAEMLQESHRSLVSTNDHLLSDLEEAKSRHKGEIEQLKWSYDKLRSATKLDRHFINGDM